MFENSPIYGLSIGSTDSGIYQNIAKEMLNGKVLYKDLFDIKGPFIFFIYTLSFILKIDYNVYLLDIIIYSISYFFIYKTLLNKTNSIYYSFIMGLICASISSVLHDTLVPESIMLLTISYMSYWIISKKYLNPSITSLLVCGVLTGIIFWTKYSIGVFIAIIYFYFIYKKPSWKNILYPFLGFSIPTSIVFGYFIHQGSLYELFYAYILVAFNYSKDPLIPEALCLISSIIAFLGILIFINRKDSESVIILLAYEVLIFFTFILSGHCFEYYYIPLIGCIIYIPTKKIDKFLPYLLISLSFTLIPNNIEIMQEKQLAQQTYKDFIEDTNGKVESIATVFDMNTSLQTLLKEINYKYFFMPNLTYESHPELFDTLYDDISNKNIEFLVIKKNGENIKMISALNNDFERAECLLKAIKENYEVFNEYGDLIVMKRIAEGG